jgi:photosystem II stability/assembly factor-like uncharacterized protein
MKTFLSILFFLLLATQICFTQWHPHNSGTSVSLNSITFADANTGWIAGDNVILKTVDGGDNWTIKLFDSKLWLTDICFANADSGLAVGNGGSDGNGVILKTIDGGENWTELSVNHAFGGDSFSGVCFTNDGQGTVVGLEYGGFPWSGIILKTVDGGTTWVSNQNISVPPLRAVSFADINNGIAVGENGTILKTTDGGINWLDHSIETETCFYDVTFIHSDMATIVGGCVPMANGAPAVILSTTDGGDNWFNQYISPNPMQLLSVHFLSLGTKNLGIAAGTFDILTTTDEGKTWIYQLLDNTNWLGGACFSDTLNCWVVGVNGTILHASAGFTYTENAVTQPTEFILLQNYPNPFNSSSVISYSISQLSNVVIKVYDIVGKEVATLVDEEKPTGIYELTLNAAILPSGVYFYQLKAGDFIQTKKMILMK